MKYLPLLFSIIICSMESPAQWSTSTYAESALYVCPGFNQDMLTFNDGSSLICGALSDSRWLQKLDPYGNKLWPQPVQVFNTPGTNNSGGSVMIPDGDEGVLLIWGDYRDATLGQYGYFNNSQFMQWIDKNGQKKWIEGGIRLSTVENGKKGTIGVFDGKGGILLYMRESDFLGPNPTNKARSWLRRYSFDGEILWEKDIDSSNINNQVIIHRPIKLGSRIAIYTLSGLKFIDPVTGEYEQPPAYIPRGGILLFNDSVAFSIESIGSEYDSLGIYRFKVGITRFNQNWDSLWYCEFKMTTETSDASIGGSFNPWMFDQEDGIFRAWSFFGSDGLPTTRIQWITREGIKWGPDGIRIRNKTTTDIFNGKKKFGLYHGNGMAQLIDSNGVLQWDTNYVVINNPGEAYSTTVMTDFNGGAIIAYWTVKGGIWAQHTGRVGKVGVITKVDNKSEAPKEFVLLQNYPNPFNPVTVISYRVPAKDHISLAVYDLLGREVSRLVNEEMSAGSYTIEFNGSRLSSGMYYYQLRTGRFSETKKMMLIK